MPSTLSQSPIKHTCFLFDQFAIANPKLRLFALHACHVVANRVQAFAAWPSTYTSMHWKSTPFLYLVDDEAFLDGAATIQRLCEDWFQQLISADKAIPCSDLFEAVLLAVEDDWEKNAYIPFTQWWASTSFWSDAERLKFFQELYPGQFE